MNPRIRLGAGVTCRYISGRGMGPGALAAVPTATSFASTRRVLTLPTPSSSWPTWARQQKAKPAPRRKREEQASPPHPARPRARAKPALPRYALEPLDPPSTVADHAHLHVQLSHKLFSYPPAGPGLPAKWQARAQGRPAEKGQAQGPKSHSRPWRRRGRCGRSVRQRGRGGL